jgi:7,8-didemethyl-8-hydroxy-5-deazariboflavin synthase CofG subunit
LELAFDRLNSEIGETLIRALEGKAPSKEEAYALINAGGKELDAVILAASIIRNREKGLRVSYSRKVFIPLTNMCRNRCGYCGFRKDPKNPSAKIMSPDEVLKLAKLGDEAGCKEALFMLGERPESVHPEAGTRLRQLGYLATVDYLRDMCQMVVDKTGLLPHSNPGILARMDLASLKDVNASMGLMLENSSQRLCNKGGPHEYSPGKNPESRLKTIEAAGELKIPFTTGILIGIGETLEERVDSLFELRQLHNRYRHLQELIIQNFQPQPLTPMEKVPETKITDTFRTVAVTRIIFQGETNIQSPPNLISEPYEPLLRAGINDWGGISNITRDFVNPQAPWPEIENLRKATAKAGFQLKMRLPVYPEYIVRIQGYLSRTLEERIRTQVDDEGYPREETT